MNDFESRLGMNWGQNEDNSNFNTGIGNLLIETSLRGRAVESTVHLDRVEMLRVVAQKVGGLGALGVEGAFIPLPSRI